jgi:hypothetical protein
MPRPMVKHLFIPIVTYPLIVSGISGKPTEYHIMIFSRFDNGIVKVRRGFIKYKKGWGCFEQCKVVQPVHKTVTCHSAFPVPSVHQRAAVGCPSIQASLV